MGEHYSKRALKNKLQLIFLGLLLSTIAIIATTPIHEATHWVLSDIDPYVEPIEIHLFDGTYFKNGQNILSSPLGYVVIKEKYSGAFNDRPIWADTLQELICISIQIVISVLIVFKILKTIVIRNENITYPVSNV